MASSNKRSISLRLPSETTSTKCYYVHHHDCRPEMLRQFHRDKTYDAALLTDLMGQTKNSIDFIYDGMFSADPNNEKKKKTTTLMASSSSSSSSSSRRHHDNSSIQSVVDDIRTDSANDKIFLLENQTYRSVEDQPQQQQRNETVLYDEEIDEMADLFLLNFKSAADPTNNRHQQESMLMKKKNKLIKDSVTNQHNADYGNLQWCRAIANTMNGDVICADPSEHRILVFNTQLMFKYQIGGGRQGNAQDEFNEPIDLIVNQINELFVADRNNCRIQIYDEKKLMKQISVPINGRKQSTAAKGNAGQFKAGTIYKYVSTIQLEDGCRPIKICSAPYSCVMACSTDNGFIFIINESRQVIAHLKMRQPFTEFDLRTICLNIDASELINLKRVKNDEYLLKFYKIIDTTNNSSVVKSSINSNSNSNTRKLKLDRKHVLQRNYLPGIDMGQVRLMRLSFNMDNLILFDPLNTTLVEFDMSGQFRALLMKPTQGLCSCLAFDYTRQLFENKPHLITMEFEANKSYKQKYNENLFRNDFKLLETLRNRSDTDREHLNPKENYLDTEVKNQVKTVNQHKFLFKLKIYDVSFDSIM